MAGSTFFNGQRKGLERSNGDNYISTVKFRSSRDPGTLVGDLDVVGVDLEQRKKMLP